MLFKRQRNEGHEPPHALKSSSRGPMMSAFQVQGLESKLTMKGTTWDKKI